MSVKRKVTVPVGRSARIRTGSRSALSGEMATHELGEVTFALPPRLDVVTAATC